MGWNTEKYIEYYYGEYKKKGVFAKKSSIKLGVYPSFLEGNGFVLYDNELSNDALFFEIPFESIEKIYLGRLVKESAIFIEYRTKSVVNNTRSTVVLLGMKDINKWINLIEDTRNNYLQDKMKKQQLEFEVKERQRIFEIEKEEKALKFYRECYDYHIQESTPVYQLFSDKNKIALIYIDETKSMNFLKIDGYEGEENNGVISYKDIHYYEKAGNISYATDIHGKYTNFGGSMTGGRFSKLATVGGGLLFGFMGMALGAALTHKPVEYKPIDTTLSIDSDIKKIDDRSVILNYYSGVKKQYIDIELPQDSYNFLQTYLPEKKYGIVHELEKKTIIKQSIDLIENGSLLKSAKIDSQHIEMIEASVDSMIDFKQKVEKLKIMKDAGLLSNDEFEIERKKILDEI